MCYVNSWNVIEILSKMVISKTNLGCVGRGVLRFWSARYRKSRSNFDTFLDFYDVSVSGGVDIIYRGGLLGWHMFLLSL